jgi:metal-responsive CopG/Arc/MetJ family transcriptional regulator
MRVHISLEDELVRELDRRAGARGRSAYIAMTLRRALEDERRWEDIEASVGALSDTSHDWDADPERWVREGREADSTRVG